MECLTLGLSQGMNCVTFPIFTPETIRPGIVGLREMPMSFSIKLHSAPKSLTVWACLGVDPLDMPRTPYRASEAKRSQ